MFLSKYLKTKIFNSSRTNALRRNMRSSSEIKSPISKQKIPVQTKNPYINSSTVVEDRTNYKINGLNTRLNLQNNTRIQQQIIVTTKACSNNKIRDQNKDNHLTAKKKLIERLNSQENNSRSNYSNNNNYKIYNNSNTNNNHNKMHSKNHKICGLEFLKKQIINHNHVHENATLMINPINETIRITSDFRKNLRPTITKICEEKNKLNEVQQDVEDINGPYNFRKFLRPSQYLPTESLRKSKNRQACIDHVIVKENFFGKSVKRRAPSHISDTHNKVIINR